MTGSNPVSVEVPPSGTLAVKGQMASLKSLGVDTISLGAGELKFELAPHIRRSFKYLAKHMALGYTAAPGTDQLRQAIAYKELQDYGIETNPATDILLTPGGKGALAALMHGTFGDKSNPNFDGRDEVIVPTPYWLSHDPMLKNSGGKMVNVDCPASQDYKITPDQLRAAITDKTKYFMLTSPHNPGGTSYTDQELEALAHVLRENPHVYIVTEDMYEHYIFDGKERTHLNKVAPDLANRTVRVNCFSKSDEMAGERVGWLSGPEAIMKPIKSLNSHKAGNAPVIGQWLGISAILGHNMMVQAYENPEAYADQIKSGTIKGTFDQISALRAQKIPMLERWRDAVLAKLETTDLVTPRPGGSFYAFPSIEAYIGRKFKDDLPLAKGLSANDDLSELGLESSAGKTITSVSDFAKAAAVHAGVGIVPGTDFEAPNSFRIAYTEERSIEAAQRLVDLLEQTEPA